MRSTPGASDTLPLPLPRPLDAAAVGTAPTRPVEPAAPERSAPTRRFRRSLWGEAWRWATTLLVFAVLAGTVAGALLVAAIYRQARTDQAGPADASVVLGTAQWNGRPGPVLRARLDHALDLYRRGLAPVVVVTGGSMPGDAYTEAEAAAAYLTEQGVPAGAILFENEGRDTWESVRGVARLAADAGLGRLLFVSDGFHLFRVKLMARDLGLEAIASPAPASPIRTGGGAEFAYAVREAGGVVEQLLRRFV
ncbi:MAG TPA: YdcF family protein [Thermomicrobiales bacterium]|nr:YdcF family protein [Thermomicrobiales bacterium]